MFTVNTNCDIKMSQGDDVQFPLFINKGTRAAPQRYKFYKDDIKLTVVSTSQATAEVDINEWISKRESGRYTFVFSTVDSSWLYNGQRVLLGHYGITTEGTFNDKDTIVVDFFNADGCEVYFYLFEVNSSAKHYLLKKTFTSSGEIRSKRVDQIERSSIGNTNINENGDMVIRLDKYDTDWLQPGNYMYEIHAKVKTAEIDNPNLVIDKLSEYMNLTVTNKYNFYLIDDNINRAW